MRVLCYFADLVPQSHCSMWRFGWLTDKHAACPPGFSVVVNLENELYVPEACGRVEVFCQIHFYLQLYIAICK
jgi:hypothetical protein